MDYFKLDAYKSNRAIWFIIGFWGVVEPFIRVVQSRTRSTEAIVLSILLLIAFVVMLLANQLGRYLMIDGEDLIISSIFWKTTVPIRQIRILSYEARVTLLLLSIHYGQNGAARKKNYSVDFMNTKTLLSFNEALVNINPAIKVMTDERSRKNQERNANLHLKAPTTLAGWVAFAVKWLAIGAAIQLALLFVLAPKG